MGWQPQSRGRPHSGDDGIGAVPCHNGADDVPAVQSHNLVEFTVEPKGEATNVSWAMQGRQPFMAKVMSTLIDCDKMVGREFETGLAKLKALAEA
jgi:hypothetical protein